MGTSGVNFCETRAQDEKVKEEAKEETKNADEEEAIKNKILDASLAHVGQHGWTRMSLTAGAEDAGYVSLVSGLFPNEGSDLVFHHVKTSNQKLNDWMTKEVERLQADGKKIFRRRGASWIEDSWMLMAYHNYRKYQRMFAP